ncbi:CACTA en-spm transposon protein [Cucumis melo var. makuwa]|uniref:CACTA en-spm transposon protein n=1 Tax=Cucumis melo var. makuwa TaxID=1194695 RepID=A0A5D3DT72_CUCMM|nr:CACTA en-spm transposon protein [Cucumis melo var. makuwa]
MLTTRNQGIPDALTTSKVGTSGQMHVYGGTSDVFVVRQEFSYIFRFSSVKDRIETKERGEEKKDRRLVALKLPFAVVCLVVTAPRHRTVILPFLMLSTFKEFRDDYYRHFKKYNDLEEARANPPHLLVGHDED